MALILAHGDALGLRREVVDTIQMMKGQALGNPEHR
jgi:hypothetical protein